MYVLLTAPPEVQPLPVGDKPLNDGDTLQVACSVPKGDLPITISWYFNGSPLQADENVVITKIGPRASFLSISSVGQNHRGNYTCKADNSGGSHSYTAPVEVNGILSNNELYSACIFM